MKEEITEVEQEDILTNNNLLFYFSGHNKDLLVPKTMENCILKTKQTKKANQNKKTNPSKTEQKPKQKTNTDVVP